MINRCDGIDATAKVTCEWLVGHDMFKSWAARHRDLLSIKGKRSGKSMLLRHALDEVAKESSKSGNAIVLSFFFYYSVVELQRTRLGLQSLLIRPFIMVPGALSELVTAFDECYENIGINGSGVPMSCRISSYKGIQKFSKAARSGCLSTRWMIWR